MRKYSKRFLLCPPNHYGISYEINPWMDVKNGAYQKKAVDQWSSLLAAIIKCEGFFSFIDPEEGHPDMVFAANAGLPLNKNTIILSHFRHKERQGEQKYWEEWFNDNGWKTYLPEAFFEGAGDALFFNGHLVCGHGFRTEKEAYAEMLSNFGVPPILVELKDPRFYHLDTCFCPLRDNDYLYYEGAFDTKSLAKLDSLAEKEGISVPEEEAVKFACNAICIDNNVILPEGCPITERSLRKRGYLPRPVQMSEFVKSGGACKCLTLSI